MSLGTNIKRARESRGLKQADIAAIFDIEPQAVSGWERDADRPDIDKLVPLARKLKVSVDWLLDGSGEPPDENDPETILKRIPKAMRRAAARLLRTLIDDSDKAA